MLLLFAVCISAAATDVTDKTKFIFAVDDEFNNIGVIHDDATFVGWADNKEAKGYALGTKEDFTGAGFVTGDFTACGNKVRIVNRLDLGTTTDYSMVWMGGTKSADKGGNDAAIVYEITVSESGTYEFIFAGTAQRKASAGEEAPRRGFCYTVDGGTKYQVDCNDILFTADSYVYDYTYENTIQNKGAYFCVGYAYGITADLSAGTHQIEIYHLEDLFTSSRLNYYGFYYQKYVENSYIASDVISGTDMSWYINKNGTLVIEGTGAIPDYTAGNMTPWSTYANDIKKVFVRDKITAVGAFAFADLKNLETAVAGSGITSIGDSAFAGCTKLISCYFNMATASIGKNAFNGCESLAAISISAGELTSLGEAAFSGCSALFGETSTLQFGNGLTEIPADAFKGCTSIKTIRLGTGITTISCECIHLCTGLNKLYIGSNTLTTIGEGAFDGIPELETFNARYLNKAEWDAIANSASIKYLEGVFKDVTIGGEDNDTSTAEITTASDPDDSDDTTTESVVTTTKTPDVTTKAPAVTTAAEKNKGCGGFASVAVIIAAFVGSSAFNLN